MKDLTVLQENPFSDMGNVSEILGDMAILRNLRAVIERTNQNAAISRTIFI